MFWRWRRIPVDTGTTVYAALCLLEPGQLKDFDGFDVFGLNDPPGPRVALPIYCTATSEEEAADVARALFEHRFPNALLVQPVLRAASQKQLRKLFNKRGPKCLVDGFAFNWGYVLSFGDDDTDVNEAFAFAFE